MKKQTESALETAGGAGIGALLGGLLGAKSPALRKMLAEKAARSGLAMSPNALTAGTGVASSVLGGGVGAMAAEGLSPETEAGAGLGGIMGSAAVTPIVKANPKNFLLKYLLGAGIGTSAGAGVGSYLGGDNG